jgi:hypothetical protein
VTHSNNPLHKRILSGISGKRGMLTVEAAILIPAALMLSMLIIMVMLFEFQSILMVAGMHQYGTIEMHQVETQRLDMKNGLKAAGSVEMLKSFELKGVAGIRTLKLNAVLDPDQRWLKRIKPVRGRSFHLKLPVNLLLYGMYHGERSRE